MNSKSICDASTKRFVCGGTRVNPDSNACSTFELQSSLTPIGLLFAFSMFKHHYGVRRTRNLVDQVLKLVVGKTARG